ncbi:d-alanyl-D-alanine carboxypeptidase/D-alanyl-D-alanine-endopeptidase [Prevotella sp. CAG:474]|nr:d-alanyl-D-alanine carboxypeptidase/D-alanyl-D-alanine-endopeptidase [Prevotella sp. CAG:474]
MTHTYLYILGWLLMWLTAVPVQAQDVAGEDETVGGTLPADTLVRDSLSLKWPQSAVHGIDRLLEADMFQTSQVGLMVYDLTADSVIYRHNERQMMRPASTMKLLR